MARELVFILIVLPFFSALLCFTIRWDSVRSFVVLATGVLLATSAILLSFYTPFVLDSKMPAGLSISVLINVADFFLLLVILYFGIKYRSLLVVALAAIQIVFLAYLEFFMIRGEANAPAIYCDYLALVMVLIITTVGSIICFQAIPYMKNHERHLNLAESRQHHFFFVMLLFLGAMNGAVLSNDMSYFYFFFELTTLCSFLLIKHDGSKEAKQNAIRALWMNSLGGVTFVAALMLIYKELGVFDFQQVVHTRSGAGPLLLASSLICFAAFTKSAQLPFQSWLLGAMVAPTPVSTLLHSSTMVKIGVYLALRLAPLIEGSLASSCLALFGAFTFLCAAALAVGQSNGKKVLAYSTISNLGLIFACAGLNTLESITAAIFLIIFHAVVKALLFMCVGAIEQHISSRNIEDMRGLYAQMPLTALITVMGVVMMIMPPFGLLLSKWMAMEAAAGNLYVILMIAVGSALTSMYWSRWAGILMSDPFAGKFRPEHQPALTWGPLGVLSIVAGLLSFAAPKVYEKLFIDEVNAGLLAPYTVNSGVLENSIGAFPVVPLCVVALLGFGASIWAVKRATRAQVVKPYLSGLETKEPRVFKGPMNRLVTAEAKNYYLTSIFGENQLTIWMNIGAIILLTLLLGGAL